MAGMSGLNDDLLAFQRGYTPVGTYYAYAYLEKRDTKERHVLIMITGRNENNNRPVADISLQSCPEIASAKFITNNELSPVLHYATANNIYRVTYDISTNTANPDATPEKLKARYESGERNAWLVKNYASYLHDEALNDRRNYEKKSNEINQMVADYYMGLSDADKFNPENFFVFRKYVTSADEPAVRFVVNNIKKVPAASRQELVELISKIYDNQEYFLISGGRPLSQEGINTFKSDLKALGINANHKYDNGITLMEARLVGDDTFIQACRTLFNKVNEMQLSGILGGLNTKFSKSDEATRKKAARVIREQLADMDVNMLYTAVMTVLDLEGSH